MLHLDWWRVAFALVVATLTFGVLLLIGQPLLVQIGASLIVLVANLYYGLPWHNRK